MADQPAPQMPAPVTVGAAPWFTSSDQIAKIKVAAGVIAVAFPKSALVAYLHLGDPVKVQAYINVAIACWPIEVLLTAFVKRMRSAIQPLVSSWAKARAHPATRAVVEVQTEMSAVGIPTAMQRQAQIQAVSDAPPPIVAPAAVLPALPAVDLQALAGAVCDEIAKRQAAARARMVATAGQVGSTIPGAKVTPAPLASSQPEPTA